MNRNQVKILVVDDDPENCFVVSKALEDEGYSATVANSGPEALDILAKDEHQMVLLDIRMPGMDGVEVLGRIRERDQNLTVIIVSAFEQVSTAVKCMRLGAYDYLTKPLNIHELKITVANALRTIKLQNEVDRLKGEIQKSRGLERMIGDSPAIQRVMDLVKKIAEHDISVLVTGSSGTGKEVVTEAIHMLSPRRDKPFVSVDCTALPEHLVESELFGYEKGAFTGATERKLGRFELANGGTLFLDEIGNLPSNVQMKLLRVLQERRLSRLGSKTTIPIDIRVVAATNADLKKMMRDGEFREDLYHRLNEFSINMPDLSERENDVELLASYFLHTYNNQFGRQIHGFTDAAMSAIRDHNWTGNVRELQNAIKRAVILADSAVDVKHLPHEVQSGHVPVDTVDNMTMNDDMATFETPETGDDMPPLKQITAKAVEKLEREMISRALKATRWNKVKAAKMLKIDYKTLYNKLKEYQID